MAELHQGFIRGLHHEVANPIAYKFATDAGSVIVNDLLGQTVTVRFAGEKACIACGRRVKKLYQNGYCFPCVTSLAECDLCIVKPHDCHFHKGTCRDDSYGLSQCMIPHYVYLAYSSDVKVGLTRKGRELTRWVDQGASAAVLVAQTPTRKAAGELEMQIASFLPDKTQWRKMLALGENTNGVQEALLESYEKVGGFIRSQLPDTHLVEDDTVHAFHYPRLSDVSFPMKSLSLDRTPEIAGRLLGVKGQYLLFDQGVFNVKRHSGMKVELTASPA